MTASTTAGLVAWLREQIAETERVARAAGPDGETHWHYGRHSECVTVDGHNAAVACGPWDNDVDEDYARHIVRHDPRAALAQCEAHTAILDAYVPVSHYDNAEESYEHATGRAVGLGEAVRALALAYQHRPGYQEEWRPQS